jgi:hypothetical protein
MMLCVIAVAVIALMAQVSSFGINIDAHEEVCFQESVDEGTKLGYSTIFVHRDMSLLE